MLALSILIKIPKIWKKKWGIIMTQTTQLRSWATLSNAGRDLTKQKPETEDDKSGILSVFDGLNNLYEKLSRLEYLLRRRNMEQILYPGGKGVTK